VIGVSLGEDADTVRGFARKLDIPFPLLLDKDGDSPRLFGLWGHPNTVVIDRQGKVIGLVRGERDWQSEPARRLVEELLQEGTSERLQACIRRGRSRDH
jgi:peroxiredoxin